MSVFAVKMLTLLGYILYAGGPVDAVSLALGTPLGGAHDGVECVVGCETETVARVVAGPVRTAHLILPEEVKMPVLRSSRTEFGAETGAFDGADASDVRDTQEGMNE